MENEAKFVFMPAEHYKGACDMIREGIGSTEDIKSGELRGNIEIILKSRSGLYDTEINALLEVAPFLTKAYCTFDEDTYKYRYGGAIVLYDNLYNQCAIIPPWITEVEENFFDNFTPDRGCCTAIFLAKTPPTIGWQGAWSSGGGWWTPRAIFVLDESIDLYKVTTNLAEFADIIYPLSQYNGEGYFGGLYND